MTAITRQAIEDEIERLIALLDAADGDPDLEPDDFDPPGLHLGRRRGWRAGAKRMLNDGLAEPLYCRKFIGAARAWNRQKGFIQNYIGHGAVALVNERIGF